MSLLTMCQDAADEIGIVQPATIISNSDTVAKQLLALARKTTRTMARSEDPPFQSLIFEGTITLVDGTQTYALASDFWWMASDTMWDRTNDRVVLFPVTEKEWGYLKGTDLGVSSLNKRARIVQNTVEFYETIGAGDDGDVLNYSYCTNKIVDIGAGGTTKVDYTLDTDVPEFLYQHDQNLIGDGIVWRWKQARGLPWQAEATENAANIKRVAGREGVKRSVNLRGRYNRTLFGNVIPESGYG